MRPERVARARRPHHDSRRLRRISMLLPVEHATPLFRMRQLPEGIIDEPLSIRSSNGGGEAILVCRRGARGVIVLVEGMVELHGGESRNS